MDALGAEATARLDRFDAVQLAMVLHTCREHATTICRQILVCNLAIEKEKRQ